MLYYVNINLILYYERFILQIKIKNCKLIDYYIPQNHIFSLNFYKYRMLRTRNHMISNFHKI